MKVASIVLLAGLVLTAPVMAQGAVYKAGDRVEALNMGTGNWEPATISLISAGRYILRSENSAIEDWDVSVSEIRVPGAGNSAMQPMPATPSAPPASAPGSGLVPTGSPSGSAITVSPGSSPRIQ